MFRHLLFIDRIVDYYPLVVIAPLTNQAMAAVPDPRNPISRVIIRFGDWLDALGDRYQAFLGKVLNRRRLGLSG